MTHVGDPLADGREGLTHCIRSDRVVGLSGLSVAETVDQQVPELLLLPHDITEGNVAADGFAEVVPVSEDLGAGSLRLGGGSGGSDCERSAEISGELTGGGR